MREQFGASWLSALPIALIFGLLPLQASSQDADGPSFSTGSLPLTPDEFAKLPKTPTYKAFLPETADLSSRLPTPGSQGRQGSCVGWAVGYAARAYYSNSLEGRNTRDIANVPSPAFIYNSIRAPHENCDAGSRIRDALNLLKNTGALSLRDFPYDASKCLIPSENQASRSGDFKIDNWLTVDFTSLDQIKGEIAKGHPVIISIRNSSTLQKLKRGQTYNVVGAKDDSWHALTLVGYDDRRQAFKVINSWGRDWADGGFGWIGFDAFRSETREAYVMRPVRPNPLVPLPENTNRPVQPSPSPMLGPPTPAPEHIPVVQGLECGRVRAVKRGEQLYFTGFVGSDADRSKLLAQAAQQNAKIDVEVRPWPQCEALLTLDRPLSERQRPLVKIEKLRAPSGAEHLQFIVKTPDFPSFLHVAYIQADGVVVNLAQSSPEQMVQHSALTKISMGSLSGDGPQFKIAPPYGREMIVVLASRSPMFQKTRPTTETEREFLSDLRKALVAKPHPNAPDRVVSAAYDTVITAEPDIISTEGRRTP